MSKFKLPKIEELFDSGVHFGHQVKRWNPGMEQYIFAEKSGIHIIDLDTTYKRLQEAADKLFEIATTGGQIIFVGTKRQAKDIVALEARRSGSLFVNERWLGGTITNFKILRKKLDKLVDFMRKRESGEFTKYTKKERLLIDREIEKLNKLVGGIVGLQGKPAALVIIDTKREKTAVKEAKSAGIPVLAVLDTNADPRDVDFPIPGNDDAIRSIAILVKSLGDAVEAGYKEYADKVELKKAKVAEMTKPEASKETVVKVSSSEAPHATEESGKNYVKKVEKGEEEGVATETKIEEKPTAKSKAGSAKAEKPKKSTKPSTKAKKS
jgi:small subunit ribosomal protein S2